MQNASEVKEKIISMIKNNGPSLPVKIASGLGMSPLFASAFLSELLSEKRLKLSNLRVGNSPVYFIAGQEPQLEKFSEHLKGKEKEAFLLLREKKFLNDEEQHPAVRVALRAIKDFAIPYDKNGKFFWRYFTTLEKKFEGEEQGVKEIKEEGDYANEKLVGKEEMGGSNAEKNKISSVKRKSVDSKQSSSVSKKKRKPSQKKNDKFFNQVKEFLSENSTEIVDIEGVSQGSLVLRVKKNGDEKLVVAYDKKRISEAEIIKANKKASELGLSYTILSLGEPLKKLSGLIEAVRNLVSIEKL